MTNHTNEHQDPMDTAIEMTNEAYGKRTFSEIAYDIIEDCRLTKQTVPYGAVPYLQALCGIHSADKHDAPAGFGFEDAQYLTIYALCNLSTYRGETARALKKELKALIK